MWFLNFHRVTQVLNRYNYNGHISLKHIFNTVHIEKKCHNSHLNLDNNYIKSVTLLRCSISKLTFGSKRKQHFERFTLLSFSFNTEKR